jgi:hypothetical protein
MWGDLDVASFFSYFSWFQIILLMVSLMSGIFSLFREVVLINHPEKAENAHLFWRCVFITFIISSVWLWISEHQQTMDLQSKLDALAKPQFVIDANRTFVSPIDSNDGMVLVTMHITNLGAPSVIVSPKMVVAVNGGNDLEGLWLAPPDRPVDIQQPNSTGGVRFQPSQYLMSRAGEKPIDHNGAVDGFMWFRVPGLEKYDVPRCVVKGEIHDAIGTTYPFTVKMISGDPSWAFPPSPQ